MNNTASQKIDIKYLSLLLRYIKPHKLKLLLVFISLLITSSSVLLISFIIKNFIDTGITQNNVEMLNHSLRYLFLIIIALATFTFIRFSTITLVGEKIIAEIRNDIFKHTLSLSQQFFEQHKSGQILSYITSDVTLLLSVISSSLSFAIRNFITIIGGIIIMLTINLWLSSMILILIPIIIIPIIFLGRKLKGYSKKTQDKISDLTTSMEQTVSYIKTIQAYNCEAYESNNYRKKIDEYLKITLDRVFLRGLLTFLIIGLSFGGIAVILWIGGHQVLSNQLSAGEFTAFIYISIVCAGAVGALSDFYSEIQKAAAAAERIFEFLETKMHVVETKSNTTVTKAFKGNIEFKDVVFSYPTSKPVLKNVSFNISPGEKIAIVGKSGAGKSTIFMLLERFYDIQEGKLTLDGTDIRSIPLSILRKQFTYISQEPVIFAASAMENILYGNPNASLEDVRHAAKLSECLEFIEQLPQGFNTFLGEKGMKLSGGQKQRIAIARAILNDPKILLLDEATSSLDAENEDLVQQALENLMKSRTVIIIAHSFTTIQNSDKVIVLDKGKIMDIGTHDSLIQNKKGIYYRLVKLQFNTKIRN
jgi:ATP-binding cassette, subfamily B, bacterial